MSRIAIIASMAVATHRDAPAHVNRPLPRREPQFAAETFPGTVASPTESRTVLWHPRAGDEGPFGLIPTEWTVQPQLLPMNWEVETLFASPARAR
jgi:hypothetical protein